jgi:hypothetical protein
MQLSSTIPKQANQITQIQQRDSLKFNKEILTRQPQTPCDEEGMPTRSCVSSRPRPEARPHTITGCPIGAGRGPNHREGGLRSRQPHQWGSFQKRDLRGLRVRV